MFKIVKVHGNYVLTEQGAFGLFGTPYFDAEATPPVSATVLAQWRRGLLALPALIEACREAAECGAHAEECRWWRIPDQGDSPEAIAASHALCDCHLGRLRAALAQLEAPEESL